MSKVIRMWKVWGEEEKKDMGSPKSWTPILFGATQVKKMGLYSKTLINGLINFS